MICTIAILQKENIPLVVTRKQTFGDLKIDQSVSLPL